MFIVRKSELRLAVADVLAAVFAAKSLEAAMPAWLARAIDMTWFRFL